MLSPCAVMPGYLFRPRVSNRIDIKLLRTKMQVQVAHGLKQKIMLNSLIIGVGAITSRTIGKQCGMPL